MGQLINFRQAGERAIKLRPKPVERDTGESKSASYTAKILLFTGVRYERMDEETVEAAKRWPGQLN